jgi:glycosyltransferase involved in cell wall biosynthesis
MGTPIGLVSRFAWPSLGGTQQVVRMLAGGLAAHGHEVEVFAQRIDDGGIAWAGKLDRVRSWGERWDEDARVRVRHLRITGRDTVRLSPVYFSAGRFVQRSRTYARYDRWLYGRLFESVISESFARQLRGSALVHRFGGNPMAAATIGAARRLDVPSVITPFAHPGHWDDDEVSAAAYRRADLVVATSRTDASLYESLGVEPERLAICPPPTAAPTNRQGHLRRSEHGIVGPLALFIGDRRSYKGVSELLDAWPTVRRRHRDATLVFIGPGAPVDTSAGGVLDLGYVSDEQRNSWLDAADVLCFPSSSESFGLVISEAWAAGVPVITSDLPVLAERVGAAGGGLAVPKRAGALADALVVLLGDDALRRELGAAGHRYWQETSTPERYLSFHEEAYARLLGTPLPSASTAGG